ncbi:SDR family NAD(P)-dependent oxidoreductase [Phycicoccus sp. CSK15P-2]|uniref:SDR family NAD(P)-dependent oxidoreductase n=1 Tax=Phycicoccus sp. CSK15P-2 TaxID=2807627 RepID=UPI0027DE5674|nr:SDR family NAD(P)-dependent oxidoreductase [Phycicoccus sp. CSK15P-2]
MSGEHRPTGPSEPTDAAKTIVITGASDGIGAAAARQAAGAGHRVVVIGRTPAKTRAVAAEIGAPYHLADFADLRSVAALADDLLGTYDRIDVLANNAGGVFAERTLTPDGVEQTFQVNHLAPFLLTTRLMPLLTARPGARLIQTSSVAARSVRPPDVADLQLEHGYRPMKAYSYAKLANVWFTLELHCRFGPAGLIATAYHPGVTASNFGSTGSPLVHSALHNPLVRRLLATPDAGARRMLWLATAPPDAGWRPGAYHQRNRPTGFAQSPTAAKLAHDLWTISEDLIAKV